MSVWFDLNVGSQRIANIEIRRMDNTHAVILEDGDVSQYKVRIDGHIIGTVQHRYGNGAFRLVCLAMDLAARFRDGTQQQPRVP